MVLNASTLTPGVERAIPDTRFQALGRVPDERPSACVRAVDAALAVPKLAVLAERIGGPLGRVLVRGEALLELFCRLEISTLPISEGFRCCMQRFVRTDHRRCVWPRNESFGSSWSKTSSGTPISQHTPTSKPWRARTICPPPSITSRSSPAARTTPRFAFSGIRRAGAAHRPRVGECDRGHPKVVRDSVANVSTDAKTAEQSSSTGARVQEPRTEPSRPPATISLPAARARTTRSRDETLQSVAPKVVLDSHQVWASRSAITSTSRAASVGRACGEMRLVRASDREPWPPSGPRLHSHSHAD